MINADIQIRDGFKSIISQLEKEIEDHQSSIRILVDKLDKERDECNRKKEKLLSYSEALAILERIDAEQQGKM